MSKTDYLRTLASRAILENGKVVPFEEQIAAYAYGDMPSGDMFLVACNAEEAGLPEVGDLPILMRQRTVRKVQAEHEIGLSQLEQLPAWLEEHPLAMESITERNALVIVADAKDAHGNDIIVAVHLNKEKQGVEISEIASIYGKRDLAFLIENTDKLGGKTYANERTGGWILRTGLQLPEQIANRLCLDSTTDHSIAVAVKTLHIRNFYDRGTDTALTVEFLNNGYSEPELLIVVGIDREDFARKALEMESQHNGLAHLINVIDTDLKRLCCISVPEGDCRASKLGPVEKEALASLGDWLLNGDGDWIDVTQAADLRRFACETLGEEA